MKQIIIALLLLCAIPFSVYANEPQKITNPNQKRDLKSARHCMKLAEWWKNDRSKYYLDADFVYYTVCHVDVKIVKKRGKYGLKIEKDDRWLKNHIKWLIPCEYDAVFYINRGGGDLGVVKFRAASKEVFYHIATGNLLPQRYYLCEESKCSSSFYAERYLQVKYTPDGPLGVYDIYQQKEVVPVRYKDIIDRDERYFWVSKTKKIDLSANNPGNLYDIASQQEIDFSSYSRVKRLNNSRLWVSKNDLWGLYDLAAKRVIIPTKFSEINTMSESSNFFLCKLNNAYAIYDTKGEELIPTSSGYTSIKWFRQWGKEWLWVGKNELWGLYDPAAKRVIIPTKFKKISVISESNNLFLCELNNAHAIYDANGKELIPASRGYTSIDYSRSNKKFTYKMTGYHGECDNTGKELTRIKERSNDYAGANNNNNNTSGSSNGNSSGKPGLLYSGTIYVSSQGYNQTTGQYFGGGPDAVFGVEIYNDYIIVSSDRYNYTRNTDDGRERVYEGTDMFRNMSYYYVNPNTFAMRLVKVYGNPYMGRNEYVSYQISNGPTTYQYNNPTYNSSGGNNNSGNSGGNSNTNRNNNNKRRSECSLCHGKRRIVRESPVPTYGNDSRVKCNECGGYFMRSTGHSHITCTRCHGRGYLEY